MPVITVRIKRRLFSGLICKNGEKIKTGKCHSVPTVQENGKIELSEQWQWTSGDYSKGESLLVEV